MLLYLHPSIESNNGFVNEKMDDDNKLCIFQMIRGNIELAKKLVKRELLVFSLLSSGCERDQMFPTMMGETWSHVSHSWVSFLLDLRDYSFINRDWNDIFLSFLEFEKMSFTIKNLDKLIFVNKNWPNDYRVSCKSPSNLLKLIGIYANL